MIEGETVRGLIEAAEALRKAQDELSELARRRMMPSALRDDADRARWNVSHALGLIESILNKGR